MKLRELIEIVDEHYDDGLIDAYYDPETQNARDDSSIGDRLAQFIVTEICETFEDGASNPDQLLRAMQVLEVAQKQLSEVIRGLEDRLP